MHSMALRARRALSAICLAALLLAVPLAGSAFAADRDDRPAGGRAVIAAPRYYYVVPRWGWNRWGWGWGPRYWDPYWSNYPGYSYSVDTTGTVKIHDSVKTDQVFLNGAFAGSSHDMKTMKLNPGNYRLEIRRDGREVLNSVVYVLTGKTVKIDVDKAA